MSTITGARRARRSFIAAAVLGTGALLGAPTSSHAGGTISYEARAASETFTVLAGNPALPLGFSPQASGPITQVSQSGLDAFALASVAYPGETGAGLLPTASSLYGVAAPSYPVQAQNTLADQQPTKVSAPGAEMEADATETGSRARATSGSTASGATAESKVELGDASVVVTSTAKVNVFEALDAFQANGITSTARISGSVGSDGAPQLDKPEASLAISSIRVPGLALKVPQSTPGFVPTPIPLPIGVPPVTPPATVPLPLGGQTLDIPSFAFRDGAFFVLLPGFGETRFPVPTETMVEALRAAGYDVTFQRGTVTKGAAEVGNGVTATVVSPTLTFRTTLPAPPQNPLANGATAVSYVFGQSVASLTVFQGDAAGGTVDTPLPPAIDDLGTTLLPEAPASEPFLPTADPGPVLAGGPVATDGAAPAARASRPGPTPIVAFGVPQLVDAGWFYVLFVAVAVGSFAGAMALRFLGVRIRWT